jgi:hypothetical protein
VLFSFHLAKVASSTAPRAPAPQAPDPAPMRAELERKRGVTALQDQLAPFGLPPSAPVPEPVDRGAIYRQLRGEAMADLPWWKLGKRRALRHQAKEKARRRADADSSRRQADLDRLQKSLDAKWVELQAAVEAAEDDLRSWVADEVVRRDQEQARRQGELDRFWQSLCANEPDAVASALQRAFVDAGAVHVVGAFDGCAALLIEMPHMEDVVHKQEPAHTSTGRLTVRARGKTRRNSLYQAAMAGRLLRVIKIAFAGAPSLEAASCVVMRPSPAGRMTPVYAGTFEREDLKSYQQTSNPDRLIDLLDLPQNAMLNLRGRTHEVSDLKVEDDTRLQAARKWFETKRGTPDHDVAAEIVGLTSMPVGKSM